ncbi:iron-sulfur cluster repair di-iron protein [Echinicola marina]|uniref:Iron-sulfur cluster repair di-iron protein n=1 Tax=Echinicola rosea TaxID=1807691 RepID=A0ABQ1VC12_9BACT|nr:MULTISPECIES: iron-sulfur cluster repair di-iron protein [Echinicola]UCS93304.1 iron-sulfur cluster repair di-iron protein [Echinicola marina]GGF50428.1 iron-sulfur cluster repair di-iron protein [Echinicola rosea]
MLEKKNIIGEVVADDYRTAPVFESFKIDFCCKGGRTIEEACLAKGLDPDKVISALDKVVRNSGEKQEDFKNWPLDSLADYIEKHHHRYVEERIPLLLQYLEKLCKVHGKAHPELFEIHHLFQISAGELTAHMKKEELILFPYVRKMIKLSKEKESLPAPHFKSVSNPVMMMMEEHEAEGDRFEKISKLSNNYKAPLDACNTYKVTYSLLDEFEKDLHRHIHLENNILFPKSIDFEQSVDIS